MVDGMERTFVRHVPPGYTGDTSVPVVIDFHPLGGTGSGWKDSTGWAELADDEGFIMIWPDGIGNSWNAGRCCRTAMDQNVDDIAFTKAIIAMLGEEACIDPKRVYATGCSNGGGMAFRVACDAADVIAGVAPVDFDCVTSADVNARSCGPECAPSRPITEVQFRGTSDTAVPYEGGLRSGGTTTFPGAQETFASFGEINQCTGMPEALAGRPSCETYPTCGSGVETVLCTVEGGTHCGSYQSFDIANVAWEVLNTKSLP
jgi:polyhydroxybutyrate depolymerase